LSILSSLIFLFFFFFFFLLDTAAVYIAFNSRVNLKEIPTEREREEVLARLLLLLPGCQQKEKETDRQRERGQIIPFTNEEEEEETYSSSGG
jgi:hypothetical protein